MRKNNKINNLSMIYPKCRSVRAAKGGMRNGRVPNFFDKEQSLTHTAVRWAHMLAHGPTCWLLVDYFDAEDHRIVIVLGDAAAVTVWRDDHAAILECLERHMTETSEHLIRRHRLCVSLAFPHDAVVERHW